MNKTELVSVVSEKTEFSKRNLLKSLTLCLHQSKKHLLRAKRSN